MEENKLTPQGSRPHQEHSIVLDNRKHLSMTGIDKVISIKPELLQVKSILGDIIITGQNIEVIKLDLDQHTITLNGKFDSVKYIESKKPLLKKIFK